MRDITNHREKEYIINIIKANNNSSLRSDIVKTALGDYDLPMYARIEDLTSDLKILNETSKE